MLSDNKDHDSKYVASVLHQLGGKKAAIRKQKCLCPSERDIPPSSGLDSALLAASAFQVVLPSMKLKLLWSEFPFPSIYRIYLSAVLIHGPAASLGAVAGLSALGKYEPRSYSLNAEHLAQSSSKQHRLLRQGELFLCLPIF